MKASDPELSKPGSSKSEVSKSGLAKSGLAKSGLAAGSGRECWLATLQLAVREVFELMLACPLEAPSGTIEDSRLDVTSMVGLAGQLSGVVTVRCSRHSAARMASRMLGVDMDHAGEEMWDAVGEVCNMVAGNFKNKINGLGDGCLLSVPTVITGGDYRRRSMVSNEFQTVFLFEGEPVVFTVEVHS
jgi:chemotaxis protein CheX